MSAHPSITRPSPAILAAAILSAALAGCGTGGLYPVEGKVVWTDGSPATELANSMVYFDLPEQAIGASGQIQSDGSFTLTTSQPGDGATAGDYKVRIIEVGRKSKPGGEEGEMAPGKIDIRYADPSTSDLVASVKPGKNEITLKVDRWKQ
jgi:hypothetical protein